uniref:Uncharacterized protein n=1 Tax=Fundulus heteroclitus TaxID=8078 RepID=A0A3Q2P599_FUNHE
MKEGDICGTILGLFLNVKSHFWAIRSFLLVALSFLSLGKEYGLSISTENGRKNDLWLSLLVLNSSCTDNTSLYRRQKGKTPQEKCCKFSKLLFMTLWLTHAQ